MKTLHRGVLPYTSIKRFVKCVFSWESQFCSVDKRFFPRPFYLCYFRVGTKGIFSVKSFVNGLEKFYPSLEVILWYACSTTMQSCMLPTLSIKRVEIFTRESRFCACMGLLTRPRICGCIICSHEVGIKWGIFWWSIKLWSCVCAAGRLRVLCLQT